MILRNYLLNSILEWWPWLNLWSDSFFLQILIIYTLFLIYTSVNVFYVVFYFFLLVLFFGIFLCVYQVELFTGFLWLIECVVVFTLLLLLFFLQTIGTWTRLLHKTKFFLHFSFFILLICYILQPLNVNYIEHFLPTELNNIDYWDNYYESLSNTNVNDFMTFLVSYYTLNSNLLLMLILIILVASVICVNLNKINKHTRIQNFDTLLKLFNFFKDNVFFIFMRQQTLVDQENQPAATRIFKKKIKL